MKLHNELELVAVAGEVLLEIPLSEIIDHQALTVLTRARELPEQQAKIFLRRNAKHFYRYAYTALQTFFRSKVVSVMKPYDFDMVFILDDLERDQVLKIFVKYEVYLDVHPRSKVRIEG